jgi:hypothetical protein
MKHHLLQGMTVAVSIIGLSATLAACGSTSADASADSAERLGTVTGAATPVTRPNGDQTLLFANDSSGPQPNGDWDFCRGKATCSAGYTIAGISAAQNRPEWFGALAGYGHLGLCRPGDTNFFSGNQAAVRLLPDAGGNVWSGDMGDWASGYWKLECAPGQYVSGVSENSPSCHGNYHFHGIRCSSGTNLLRTGCRARVFEDIDGRAVDTGDWDPNYFKGECGLTEYVAGVSVNPANRRPHSIMCCPKGGSGTGQYGRSGPAVGDAEFGNNTIAVKTSAGFGGAISSLVYGGQEFVNTSDHGRELQMAMFLDNYGECLNPTEAGNYLDPAGYSSTRILSTSVGPGTFFSHVNPAYYVLKGQPAGSTNPCSTGLMSSNPSADQFKKWVTVGAGGNPNVIEYKAYYALSQSRSVVYFEAPTAYLRSIFNRHLRFDPASGVLHEYREVDSDSNQTTKYLTGNVPAILAAGDGWAMGMWSPDEAGGRINYNVHQFYFSWDTTGASSTSKLTVGVGYGSSPPSQLTIRTYIVVGSLQTVVNTIQALYRANPTNVSRRWPDPSYMIW